MRPSAVNSEAHCSVCSKRLNQNLKKYFIRFIVFYFSSVKTVYCNFPKNIWLSNGMLKVLYVVYYFNLYASGVDLYPALHEGRIS